MNKWNINLIKADQYENGDNWLCLCVWYRSHLSPEVLRAAYVPAITCNLTWLLYYLGSELDLRWQPMFPHHHIQSNGCSKCISKRKKDITLSAEAEIIVVIASTCIILTPLYKSSLMIHFWSVIVHFCVPHALWWGKVTSKLYCICNLNNVWSQNKPKTFFQGLSAIHLVLLKGTVVILPMNHWALVCTDTKRQSHTGLTHPHDTFFTELFISARWAEAVTKSVSFTDHPAITRRKINKQHSSSVGYFLYNEERGCEWLVQNCQLPKAIFTPPHITQHQLACFDSLFQFMTSTLSASLN